MPRPSEWYDIDLPKPDNIELPIDGGAVQRPDPELIERLYEVSSATAAATLHRMGIRQTYMANPKPRVPGRQSRGACRHAAVYAPTRRCGVGQGPGTR